MKAFAKINLTLRVLGTRPDGYHALETTFQSIALHDTLTFAERDGPFEIVCDDPACPVDETNLVWRAADRMWKASGRRSQVSGLRVQIVKRIPAQAGLGGGSSDAAATMRALARLWRMDLRSPGIRGIAAGLGADVPFFLEGGTALGVGRGDRLHALPDASPFWVVIVVPPFGISTVQAYRWWDADRGRTSAPTNNDLQPPVERRRQQIGRIVRKLYDADARYAAMSGSGSAVFGLFERRAAAVKAVKTFASSRSRQVVLTRTMGRAGFRQGGNPLLQ